MGTVALNFIKTSTKSAHFASRRAVPRRADAGSATRRCIMGTAALNFIKTSTKSAHFASRPAVPRRVAAGSAFSTTRPHNDGTAGLGVKSRGHLALGGVRIAMVFKDRRQRLVRHAPLAVLADHAQVVVLDRELIGVELEVAAH